ncbi:chloride channel protein [Kitasatospora sp. NPDC052868]|uniref:chloride channel protein n=1 Tax=Kitasatospora sp. NPDC052868 TaxID=3364060 RepID=UPI0037CA10DD
MPQQPVGDPTLSDVVLTRGYLGLLLIATVVGIPVSLAAFGFVSLEHELQHWVWESLPQAVGLDRAPWWWPLPALLLAGLLLVPVVTRLPGRGGHVPVDGLGGPPTPPNALPRRTAQRTVLCAVAVGACITAFALLTGRSPEEAALSGQATLGALAADPQSWSIGALVALTLCKAAGWGIALGSLRGGPIFPALLIGAAIGVACGALPGLGTAPGLAAGLAASGAAVTRLPVTSTVLAAELLGGDATNAMPLLIVATATGFLTGELIRARATGRGAGRAPVPAAAGRTG